MIFDPPAYGLADFRKAHNLSFLQFHGLRELALAPRTILIGDKPYITRESAAEWREGSKNTLRSMGGRLSCE
jgi:hypothetical protein